MVKVEVIRVSLLVCLCLLHVVCISRDYLEMVSHSENEKSLLFILFFLNTY